MKRFAAACAAIFLCCSVLPLRVQAAAPATSASSAILIDAASGRVLYEQNAHERRLIASITKLMTALVAVESASDLDRPIEIRPEWTGIEGSSMYLRAGEQLTLKELLYGLLLASGNDAAVAIVDWMNEKAGELGMKNTHFANPNGLNDDQHYSTAADMAQLARVVMENQDLETIVGTKSITLAGRTLSNHNKLLWRYEGCVGMKTGYTDKAGRTLVSCAQRDGQRLIAVTLNDPNDWQDHAALFDYGFENYPSCVLALEGREVTAIPVEGSLRSFVTVRTDRDVFYPLAADERVKVKMTLPEQTSAPLKEGAIAGAMTYYLGEEPIGAAYLVYADSVADDRAGGDGLVHRLMELLFHREPLTSLVIRQ